MEPIVKSRNILGRKLVGVLKTDNIRSFIFGMERPGP